jgi:N6-L-threonylcarbamoyladenine synthase
MKILSIETSCDETAASIVSADGFGIQVLANTISSQVKLHAKWGGVVPNLAAREHLKNFVPVLDKCFKSAQLLPQDIDLMAVTQGPGLIPALLIGVNAAKTLSYVWKKPLIGIHHIEGHIFANFISDKISECQISNVKCQNSTKNYKLKTKNLNIKFPILCLVVSGGHTQLILMKKHLDYEIIGETLDDAAGEAFDKVARILGLGYPGGPIIAAKAAEFRISNLEFRNKSKFKNFNFPLPLTSSPTGRGWIEQKRNPGEGKINLPRPMINSNNFNFSFSGLKTAVLYKVKTLQATRLPATGTVGQVNYKLKTELCHEFQQAVIDVLIHKTMQAAKKYNPKTIMLAGGVSANLELRSQLGNTVKKELPMTDYRLPMTDYSIDNASMIASAAYYRWKNLTAVQKKKAFHNWKNLEPDANMKII